MSDKFVFRSLKYSVGSLSLEGSGYNLRTSFWSFFSVSSLPLYYQALQFQGESLLNSNLFYFTAGPPSTTTGGKSLISDIN